MASLPAFVNKGHLQRKVSLQQFFSDRFQSWDTRNGGVVRVIWHPESSRRKFKNGVAWISVWGSCPDSKLAALGGSGLQQESGLRGAGSPLGLASGNDGQSCIWVNHSSEDRKPRSKERPLDVLLRMDKQGRLPSVETYTYLLHECVKQKALEEAMHVRAHIAKNGLEGHSILGETVINMLVKCGNLAEALRVFDKLSQRTAVSWTAVITGYSNARQGRKALHMYEQMRREGVHPNKHTFRSLLKACGSLSDLEEGKRIHTEVVRHRCDSDLYVATTLLDMYARCGSMVDARSVFDSLTQRDVVAWSAMIAGYTQQEKPEQALELYSEMCLTGLMANERTLVSVLKACGRLGAKEKEALIDGQPLKVNALRQGKIVHDEAVRAGFMSDAFVQSSLVHMYATCGSIRDAQLVFDTISQREVVLWNTMIAAYAQLQHPGKALDLYGQMQLAGVKPDERTFVSLLKACANLATSENETLVNGQVVKLSSLQKGRKIHSDVIQNDLESRIYICNTLVHLYANCGSLEDARRVFDAISQRSVVSWNSMISGYADQDRGEQALQLYGQMQKEGVIPNDRTFVGVLKALSSVAVKQESSMVVDGQSIKVELLERGRVIHADIMKRGYESDMFVGNSLVHMYGNTGSLVDARRVFDRLTQHDVVSWNAMIAGYAQQEQAEEALQLYGQMQAEGVQPNERTFVSVLKACAALAAMEKETLSDEQMIKSSALQQGKAVHAEAIKTGYASNLFVGSILVHMYATCGSTLDARQVFNTLSQRDVVVWNAMIGGYAQQGQGEEALKLYAQMQKNGVKPDESTFQGILKACGVIGALNVSIEIHHDIITSGIEWTVELECALINAYGKCGSMVDARNVFDSLRQPNLETWSALIAGYARKGDCDMCFNCFQEMLEAEMKPDAITFTSLLSACSHAGMTDKGLEYFESMTRDFGISPSMEHYVTMIDMWGRAGMLSKAEALVFQMPMEPDLTVWLTLLGGCRKHVNVELGRRAFECAVRLDPTHCAAYGLMSNIYASAKMADEASRIEELRGHVGAWKKAGQSWIEHNKEVHKFRVGDQRHPQSHEVYARLRELSDQMISIR